MEKMDTAFRLKMMFDLQHTKLDLALEALEEIGVAAATASEDKDSLSLEIIAAILSKFTERWDELCSEQA